MIVLNYAHPLTTEQLAQLIALIGVKPEVRDIAPHADRARPLGDLARELADAAQLSSHDWQASQLLLNPPGLAPLALALIAEIHGRGGHFVSILNVRPVADSALPTYEIAEIVPLQTLRDTARTRR